MIPFSKILWFSIVYTIITFFILIVPDIGTMIEVDPYILTIKMAMFILFLIFFMIFGIISFIENLRSYKTFFRYNLPNKKS